MLLHYFGDGKLECYNGSTAPARAAATAKSRRYLPQTATRAKSLGRGRVWWARLLEEALHPCRM
jgi:PPE-repeat protein